LNEDSQINSPDLILIINWFGSNQTTADFNHNGLVESDDLFEFSVRWRSASTRKQNKHHETIESKAETYP
jgi:hypothetical protein